MGHIPMTSDQIRRSLAVHFTPYEVDTLLTGALGLLKAGYAAQTVEAHLVLAGCSGLLAENVVARVLLPRIATP